MQVQILGQEDPLENGNPLQYSYLENPMDRVRHDWSYLAHMRCGAGEDSSESLDYKEIQPVYPKRNQSWIFIGRTDAEDEIPILWPPDAKSQLIGKDPNAGKDRRQEEKRVTEDEMVGWHPRLNAQEFERTPGDSERQGSLVCCSPWGCKESDTT